MRSPLRRPPVELALAAVLACLAGTVSARLGAQRPALDLRVMTFNLRYASARPPNAWSARRPVMKAAILAQAPDLIGTQEGLYPQLKDIAADLHAYEWIGLGRDGGSRGEFMAVFYRRDRFEPLAFDHFWLSDTPDVVASSTWGNSNRRMVTWVRFRDTQTDREFSFWNTHLDHEVEAARQKASALIRDRMARVEPGVPLILVGDFNCPAGTSVAFETLTKDGALSDAWTLAKVRVNERVGTFHNYRPPPENGPRIDWILVRGNPEVRRAEIVSYQENGQFPSDHFPVVVDIRF